MTDVAFVALQKQNNELIQRVVKLEERLKAHMHSLEAHKI